MRSKCTFMRNSSHRLLHWCTLFVVCVILLLLAVLVTILFTFLKIVTLPIPHASHTDEYIDERIKEYEEEVLKRKVKSKIVHINLKIGIRPNPLDTIRIVDMHVLHVHSNKEAAPVLILIHGAAASSLSFADTMDALAATFDLYVVDLPGFGRSHVNATFEDVSSMYEDTTDFHCDVVYEFLKTLKTKRVYLCGHSFGAYVCVRFCKRFPTLIVGLILINPAGIFPTLGGLGMYWACVFRFSIPNAGRRFGRLGYVTATYALRNSPEASYWYYVLAHPRGFGDSFVREKVTFHYFWAYWNQPVFDSFDGFTFPIRLIYGEDDTIMPAHQGMVLRQIHGYELRLIENYGHSPIDNALGAGAVAEEIHKFFAEHDTRVRDVLILPKASTIISPSSYGGSFYVPEMYCAINRLYKDVGKRYGIDIDVDPTRIEKWRFMC